MTNNILDKVTTFVFLQIYTFMIINQDYILERIAILIKEKQNSQKKNQTEKDKLYRIKLFFPKWFAHFAKADHIRSDFLFETRLYKRFTHLGAKRRLKWLPDASSPSGYSPSTQTDWGNFISYLNKANFVMGEINKDNTIANQYKKVWNNFHEIKKATNKDIITSKIST